MINLGLAVSFSARMTSSGLADKTEQDRTVDASFLQTDFPVQAACIRANFPNGNIAKKGLALRLGSDAAVLFDTELLRMAAGWTGGYITTTGVAFDGAHENHPSIAGEQHFATPPVPGWITAQDEFRDTRAQPYGPLSADKYRWQGYYVAGTNVVLAYTVAGTQIYEQPSSVVRDEKVGFVRSFQTGRIEEELRLMICEMEGQQALVNASGGTAMLMGATNIILYVAAVGLPDNCRLEGDGNRITLRLAKGARAGTFKLVLWRGPRSLASSFATLTAGEPKLAEFKKGGPARWPEVVGTRGILGFDKSPDGAFTVDQLSPPVENPWKRRVRLAGFDFFPNGKQAALCTWDGDIWILSGLDAQLENLQWRRFASGGFETLGLKVVDGVIHTSGRDQITRYHDLNDDGEADFYENFNNEITLSRGFHEFVFDLQTDRQGNFYFSKAGPVRGGGSGFGGGGANGEITAHAGSLLKLSKDGKKLEVLASGFRAPNGIGVGPNGELTTGDNEGTDVMACPLNWVKPGGFYGVEATAHRTPIPPRDPPLCWFPKEELDNSGASQVWVTSDQWGPFKGELLHLSYGKCTLNLILRDPVRGQMQGGAVRLPLKLTSSAMRARFNPQDGQLYVAGFRGWQTSAANPTGFDRVRYTGKPVYSVAKLKTTREGVQLAFTQPLDRREATDIQNYSAKRWNYVKKFGDGDKIVEGRLVRGEPKTPNYGGHEVIPEDPAKVGRESVDVQEAKLSPDGKTLSLKIDDWKPVMQFLLKYNLKARDRTPIEQTLLQTIHALP